MRHALVTLHISRKFLPADRHLVEMKRVLDFAIFHTPGDRDLAVRLEACLKNLGEEGDKWEGKVVETLSVM